MIIYTEDNDEQIEELTFQEWKNIGHIISKQWYNHGVEIGATHLIIGSDDKYQPIYVMPDDDINQAIHYCEIGGHIEKVYDLSVLFEYQQCKGE